MAEFNLFQRESVGGEEEDGEIFASGFGVEFSGEVEAGHSGHLEIGDHEVDGDAGGDFHGFLGVVGDDDIEAGVLQL